MNIKVWLRADRGVGIELSATLLSVDLSVMTKDGSTFIQD